VIFPLTRRQALLPKNAEILKSKKKTLAYNFPDIQMLHDEQTPNKKRCFKKRGMKIRKFQHSSIRKEEERQINTTGVDRIIPY
jgi:hypothetical protein